MTMMSLGHQECSRVAQNVKHCSEQSIDENVEHINFNLITDK